MHNRRSTTRQGTLPLGNTWGGKRRGAGRKRTASRPGVPHMRRPAHNHRHPLHVTLRVRDGLPSLREESLFLCIRRQIGAAKKRFLRIVHFSVQANHLHFLVETSDRVRLSSGMKGLGVRVARRLNQLLGTRGSVCAERYHARALTSPRGVRNALVYVLFNHRKHGRRALVDPCSSARYVEGWCDQEPSDAAQSPPLFGRSERGSLASREARPPPSDWPVARGETWLLSRG